MKLLVFMFLCIPGLLPGTTLSSYGKITAEGSFQCMHNSGQACLTLEAVHDLWGDAADLKLDHALTVHAYPLKTPGYVLREANIRFSWNANSLTAGRIIIPWGTGKLMSPSSIWHRQKQGFDGISFSHTFAGGGSVIGAVEIYPSVTASLLGSWFLNPIEGMGSIAMTDGGGVRPAAAVSADLLGMIWYADAAVEFPLRFEAAFGFHRVVLEGWDYLAALEAEYFHDGMGTYGGDMVSVGISGILYDVSVSHLVSWNIDDGRLKGEGTIEIPLSGSLATEIGIVWNQNETVLRLAGSYYW